MEAILSGALYLPVAALGPVGLSEVKKALTVRYFQMGEDTPNIVEAYREDTPGYIGVPRQFGLRYLRATGSHLAVNDMTSIGRHARFPKRITPWEYQVPFIQGVYDAALASNDFLAHAATGKGKTVMSLAVAAMLKRTTLVIVDQDNLKEQWREAARKFLGLKTSDIGIIQGKECTYEGRPLVIAMVHTLVQRVLPPEVYDYFGLVITDEAHTAGAPTFSRALMMFSATSRFGVSATIDRRDSLQKIIHWNLGEVAVSLTDAHSKSLVWYIESDTVYSWYANVSPKTGRYINEIAEDSTRNFKLAQAAVYLYNTGRDVLVLSDRIEQLEAIMALCAVSAVPQAEMGLYCGNRHVWRYAKDAKPLRRPPFVERGAEYTPVALQYVERKVPKAELLRVKENARIIFATFGMFSKGVDERRLSAGIDCTPRSKAEQVHGRILRVASGKLIPIWVTVRDVSSFRSEYQFSKRIREYANSEAEIYLWDHKRGVKRKKASELSREAEIRSKELRTYRIVTQLDGRNTLVT